MKELLIYALEVLVCSAALLLAYSVLLERRTAFLHCRLYLIGAMLLAALIPALSIPVWTGETLYMAADPVAAAAPTATPAATDAGTPSLPVAVTLFLYALGVLLSFGAMIAQIVRIRRLRHGARTIRRADCDIVLTQADISSFSFFRTVYLHDAIPESDMAAVVAHELSHIRHRHSAERIVMECVKALLWWNPFVRIAARRLAEVEEYEADRDVLTQGYDPSEYIATIFKTQFGYSPDIANGLRDSLTKKRFQMMTKHSGDSRALLRLAGIPPAAASASGELRLHYPCHRNPGNTRLRRRHDPARAGRNDSPRSPERHPNDRHLHRPNRRYRTKAGPHNNRIRRKRLCLDDFNRTC